MNYKNLSPLIKTTPEKIITATSKLWGVTEQELLEKCRRQPQAFARQVAMFLTYKLTNLSTTNVGKCFSNRNHATILWAIKRVMEAMESEPQIKHAVIELEKYLTKQHEKNRSI
jgi:chromosomal replication initiator protein